MDKTQNRVAADLAQVDAMTRKWERRYGNGNKRTQKEFGRTKLALQKEVVRRYQGKPLNAAEKNELRMLKAENKDLAKSSRRPFLKRAGSFIWKGLRFAGKFLLKGTGFVLGTLGIGIASLAGFLGFKRASGNRTPVVSLGNNSQSRVLNSKSPAGKIYNQVKRNYGKHAKQQQRTAPRVSNGLGR